MCESVWVCVLVVVTADKAFRHSVSHLNQVDSFAVVGNIVLHVCVCVCVPVMEKLVNVIFELRRENAYMQLMRGSSHSFY